MDSATAAYALKNAFYSAAQALFVDDDLYVSFGQPSPGREEDDILAFTGLRSQEEPGPISATRRTRNEHVELDVVVSCWRAGEADDDKVPTDAVYAYLRRLEQHVRVTDTTLGGACLWCFLDSHQSTGVADRATLAKGRLVEATATFKAFVRITS